MDCIKNVPRGTLEKVLDLVDVIYKFNKAHRLVGTKKKEDFVEQHVLPIIEMGEITSQNKIYDIGSGNGIPGLVLAIMGFDVCLVEIDRNKSYVLNEIAKICNLYVSNINDDYRKIIFEPSAIVSKGLLDANKTAQLMKDNKEIKEAVLIKGHKAFEEKKDLVNLDFVGNIVKSNISDSTNFLKISRL